MIKRGVELGRPYSLKFTKKFAIRRKRLGMADFSVGGIHQFFTEDRLDITILLIIGILFITAGILVKRWAHKNGNK